MSEIINNCIFYLIWFIAGLLNGLMDSIQFHNSYKKYGYRWSLESWQMKKFLGFAPNIWHFAKYLQYVLLVGSYIFYPNNCLALIFVLPFFMIGFKISYK